MLATGQHDPPDRDLVHPSDGLPDHGEGVVTDLAIGAKVVGPDKVTRIDVGFVHEFIDLDGARGFQRDLLEFFFGDLDELVLLDLVAPDDVLVRDLVTGVHVHLQVLDSVAGLPVELVERDLLALGCGGVKRHRAGKPETIAGSLSS